MGEVQHSHSKTDTAYQLHSPICFLNGVPCDFRMIEEYGEGLGGWSCCQVDSSSGAISRTRWFKAKMIAKATTVMARDWWLLRWCRCSGQWAEMRVEGSRCFQRWNRWRGGDMADMVVVGAFLSWWNENNAVCTKIKQEGRERENDLNFYLRKIWRHRWIQIVCNEKMWDYQQ